MILTAALGGAVFVATIICAGPALADDRGDYVDVDTVDNRVRVVVVRVGGDYSVRSVSGVGDGGGGEQEGCTWTLVFAPELDDVPLYGPTPGPLPHPDARLAVLLCDGVVVRPVWISPDDIIDLDEIAREEAERYVRDVLVPDIAIGVNPSARGLVGLRSWFWIEGFSGSVQAPPIGVFGMTIEVRMASGTITWDFGDGTVTPGDLGLAYPVESTVQHAHGHDGTFTVRAEIALLPEYRVDGGPWLALPPLSTSASVSHEVEERQAVLTEL